MKKILMLIFLYVYSFSYTLDNVPLPTALVFYDSPLCGYSTSDTDRNKYHTFTIKSKSYSTSSSEMSSNGGDFTLWDNFYEGFLCSENSSINSYWSYGDRNLVTVGRTEGEFIVLTLKRSGSIEIPLSSCQDLPNDNILNGLDYQANVANNSDCQSMYSDNGDNNGFFFSNPNLDSSCFGFCYYNLPDNTTPDPDPDPTPDPTPDPDPDPDPDPIDTGETVDLAELIPYIDEIEQKNQNISDSLDTLNTNLNTEFNQINSNSQSLDTTMQSLDSTLQNIDDTLQNLSTQDNTNSK